MQKDRDTPLIVLGDEVTVCLLQNPQVMTGVPFNPNRNRLQSLKRWMFDLSPCPFPTME